MNSLSEREKDKSMFIVMLNAIAYFLAGSFALKTAVDIKTIEEITTIRVVDWVTFIVSSILIIAGFLYLEYTLNVIVRLKRKIQKWLLYHRNIQKIYRKIGVRCQYVKIALLRFNKLSTAILIVFLFTITVNQVLATAIGYYNDKIMLLFIVSTIFLLILLVSIIYNSRDIFFDVGQLLNMIFALNFMGIYVLLKEDFTKKIDGFPISISEGEIQLTTILLMTVVLIVFALKAWSRQRTRQLKLKL